MANDDDVAWYDDENVWIEHQRNAGAFRNYEDECRARVMFRHFPKIMERVLDNKASQPPIPDVPKENAGNKARKPSLERALLEAKKAGVNVAAATVTGQGVALTFGEAAKTDSNELDQWMEKHKNAN